jgi:hypothetical protein
LGLETKGKEWRPRKYYLSLSCGKELFFPLIFKHAYSVVFSRLAVSPLTVDKNPFFLRGRIRKFGLCVKRDAGSWGCGA